MAHIERASPRRVSHDGPMSRNASIRTEELAAAATPELVERPFDDRMAERRAALRHVLAESTFFLFDPESWR